MYAGYIPLRHQLSLPLQSKSGFLEKLRKTPACTSITRSTATFAEPIARPSSLLWLGLSSKRLCACFSYFTANALLSGGGIDVQVPSKIAHILAPG